jgi:hypothetical protein
MLNAEEAAARLTTLQDPQWRTGAERRVGKLPGRLREPATAFVAPDPDSSVRNSAQEHRDRQLAAARALDGMPGKHRGRVMDALHPGLGPALARWWTDAQHRPYLRGWTRKAFRAADSPGLTLEGRAGDLARLVSLTGPYQADPVWLAIWGGHLTAQIQSFRWPTASLAIGGLLASAIDLGGRSGEETLAALIEVGNGEHPAGIMGRHVIVALLGSSRPEGWEFAERLLLAAQRQEGLRQSILEAADEGNPAAFDRMLAVVLDNKLLRFAASVRAVGVWLGFGASVADIPLAQDRVRKLAAFRASDTERTAALTGTDPWDVYIALCARGMRDVLGTVTEARRLADGPSPDLRAAALRYVAATNLVAGQKIVAAAVDDEDVRVASLAASLLRPTGLELPGTFDALARLAARLPASPRQETGLGVEQFPVTVSRPGTAALLVRALGQRPAADLVPWLLIMDSGGRASAATLISGEGGRPARRQELTAELRPVLIGLLSDRSSHVRGIAIRALTKTRLAPSEAPAVEALLTRSATDIRRGALTMQGSQEMLFGDIKYHFPWPFGNAWQAGRVLPETGAAPGTPSSTSPGGAEMVLGDVFRAWWADRPAALRGEDDGLDALRAYTLARIGSWRLANTSAQERDSWWPAALGQLTGDLPRELRQLNAVLHVAIWLVAEHASGKVIDECLDALEATLAAVPHAVLTAAPATDTHTIYHAPGQVPHTDWRFYLSGHPWSVLLGGLLQSRPELFAPGQIRRWYRLMRWVERPHPDVPVLPVTDRLLLAAHGVGAASDEDVATAFLRPRNQLLKDLTRRWRGKLEARYPAIAQIADQVRDRVIAVELRRGDLPTPTSPAAMNLGSVSGVRLVAELLRKLGDVPLARGWRRQTDSRDDVFSHLVRVSFPADGQAGADLKAAADEAGVTARRLVDLALYAPQWAVPVEEALGWPGLTDGVLCRLVPPRLCRARQRAMGRAAQGRQARVRRQRASARAAVRRGDARSAGRGRPDGPHHGQAPSGRRSRSGPAAAARGRRGTAGRHPAKVYGAARVRAGQQGVRRDAAGQRAHRGAHRRGEPCPHRRIPGPLRFTWAVEAQQAGDLADGPITVTKDSGAKDSVTLTLSVDAEGVPDLAIRRGDRPLRSVPTALRKDADVAALAERKAALSKQAARVRESLEAAMVAQDAFTVGDLADLRRHPVVAPMLAQLVWLTEDGQTRWLPGARADSAADGPADGRAGGPLRIAHPVDFVADGSWVSWQERLFAAGRRQPFKQVFRELYVLTGEEGKAGPFSRRYDGHQLQPRQALALLGRRGWVTSWEAGEAARAFHRHDLVARVTFGNGFFTPAEVDLPTIDGVCFTRRGEYLAQPLGSVPKAVFSETMRDLDLVVSVAHAGGVDPEATASTTEMRAALIRETARLLKLENIEFAGSHAVIAGRLGEYSLHLGSGTVHRRPGGAVCIVPVGSQHRGRIFLPFADDDPKTAEIVSKALLLARDYEIKDPAILEQLRS